METKYDKAENVEGLRSEIVKHVEQRIMPRYDAFDRAHDRSHARQVIDESLRLAQHYDVNRDISYIVAAYHDLGLEKNRATHHTESARIVKEDDALRQWFSSDEIKVIAEAVEDHRASASREPRSIYGRIVAEADRQIVPSEIIRRTVEYGLDHYPELDKEGHWQRMLSHLQEKYAEGGYLKLYLPDSRNAEGLANLRKIIENRGRLREMFEQLYDENDEMRVRHANYSDLPEIMEMIENSRAMMRYDGNTKQWVNGYPSVEAIEKDIREGHGYVIYKGGKRNIGYFAFIIGIDPTYSHIDGGQWDEPDQPYGTIHRMACHERVHGVAHCGIGWCKQQIERLRIDTHEANNAMRHIAIKEGFIYRGVIYVDDGTPRLAYQWKSTKSSKKRNN